MTPSSKVVGDLALHLAAVQADPDDFAENPQNYDIPDSVVGFMAGELGELPGGWPEPFRTKVLAGKTVKIGVEDLAADDATALEGSQRRAPCDAQPAAVPRADPHLRADPRAVRRPLGGRLASTTSTGSQPGHASTSSRSSRGVRLYIGLEAIGEADDKGMRTVMTTLNGQLRPVFVRDRSIVVETKAAEKADSAKPGQVAAPFSGVVTLQVERRRPRSPPVRRSRRSRP